MSKKRLFLIFCGMIVLFSTNAQERIQIDGQVRSSDGRSLAGATLLRKGTTDMVATDDEGSFTMKVVPNDVLIVSSMGHTSREIEVKGQRHLRIELTATSIKLKEIEVIAELKDKILPDPTDLEVEGDYVHLRTRFRIPGGMIKKESRLIIQPIIRNLTQKEAVYLKPIVCEGSVFAISKQRLLEFDVHSDPLTPYTVSLDSIKGGLINYHDSLKMENLDTDYRSDILFHIAFDQRTVFQDSMCIAKGVVNPLRFITLQDAACWMSPTLAPKPAPVFRQERGEINLQFGIGESKIDTTLGNNLQEIERFKNTLSRVDENPQYQLESFLLDVSASPDGSFAINQALLKKRALSAEALVKTTLNPETVKKIYLKSTSEVVDWSKVEEELTKDQIEQRNLLQSLIHQYGKQSDRIWTHLKKDSLGEILKENYLPKFRKVAYQFTYSTLRELKDEELAGAFQEDPLSLSANEWWRLLRMNRIKKDYGMEVLNRMYQQAIKMYPNEYALANDYVVWKLRQDQVDEKTLLKWVSKDNCPQEVITNQILVYLRSKHYGNAYELAKKLKEDESNATIQSLLAIHRRDYAEAFRLMNHQGANIVNKMALLLMMKRDEEALNLAMGYHSKDPKIYYLRAMAANRLDKMNEAIIYLTEASRIDPHYLEVARLDADLMDIVDSVVL